MAGVAGPDGFTTEKCHWVLRRLQLSLLQVLFELLLRLHL